jgi:hypothetical protein
MGEKADKSAIVGCTFVYIYLYISNIAETGILKSIINARHPWLMPVIPVTWEAEFKRIWFKPSLKK